MFKSKKMLGFSAAITVAATLLLAACTTEPAPGDAASPAIQPAAATAEKVYRYSEPVDSQTANTHVLGLNYDGIVADYCTGLLYREVPTEDGKAGRFVDELADGLPVQADDEGLVWHIKIHPDAVWANGEQINADTFIYSWKMILDPDMLNANASRFAVFNVVEIANAYNYNLSKTENAVNKDLTWEDVGIKKIDDMTIELTLVKPVQEGDLMRHLSLRNAMPVYEPYYEAGMNESRTVTSYATELDNFMSSGPFIFTKWTKGAERIYEKNHNSRIADLINFDKVNVRIVPDSGTELQMFENGEIDICELYVDSLEQYEEDPRLWESASTLIFHWEINRTNPDQPIFTDVNFRRALYYSMDRNVFAKLTAMRPAPYYISSMAYFDQESGILYRDLEGVDEVVPPNGGYNPELAKEYFDTAMAAAGLDSIHVKVLYEDTGDTLKRMAEYWQQDVEKIFEGRLTMEMVTMPDQQKTAVMRDWAGTPAGYEIGGHAFSNAQAAFYPWLSFSNYTKDFQRYTNYGNEKFNQMYADVITPDTRYDKDKLKESLMALEKEFIDDVLNLPTVEYMGYILFSERLILPVDAFKPGIGFAEMFADIDLSK